jgi:hypothetical protein
MAARDIGADDPLSAAAAVETLLECARSCKKGVVAELPELELQDIRRALRCAAETIPDLALPLLSQSS